MTTSILLALKLHHWKFQKIELNRTSVQNLFGKMFFLCVFRGEGWWGDWI